MIRSGMAMMMIMLSLMRKMSMIETMIDLAKKESKVDLVSDGPGATVATISLPARMMMIKFSSFQQMINEVRKYYLAGKFMKIFWPKAFSGNF